MASRLRYTTIACCLIAAALVAQAEEPLIVQHGQILRVRLLQQLSSATGISGQVVKMEACSNLMADGHVLVSSGAAATATLSLVNKKAKFGQGGRISLHISGVEMVDGETLPLDLTQLSSGGGPDKRFYKGLVIASIVLLSPSGTAAVFLLHGQDVVLPEGTEFDAQIGKTMHLEPTNFPSPTPVEGSSSPPLAVQNEETMALRVSTSVGDGSLWIDDEFSGETPTEINLEPGIHMVKVVRTGYKPWRQRVLIDGSKLNLLVNLEKR